MVTRFTRTLAFTLLFIFPNIHAMEEKSEEAHTHYQVTMSGGYRDDYEKLYAEFTGDETVEEFTAKYPWYQLDRREETLKYFRYIKRLLQDNDGQELVIEADDENAIILDLSFKNSVPESAFSGDLFDTSPRHSGRSLPLVKRVEEEETEQRSRSSSGSSYTHHPNDRTGMKPWYGQP